MAIWTNSENTPPSEFTLVAPGQNSEETTLIPTFSWTESSDPDLYDRISYTLSYGTEPSDLTTVIPTVEKIVMIMNIHLSLVEKVMLLLNFRFTDKSNYVVYAIENQLVSEWAELFLPRISENEETDFQMNLTGEKIAILELK